MNKLRIGQVGVGAWGKNHCEILARMPDVNLVGLHDLHFERCGKTAGDFDTREFDDLRELLEAVDALVVTAPTAQHYDLARRALEHGKHVFVEKPMCAAVAEAEQLVGLSRDNNLVLQVGHIERFNPAFQAILNTTLAPIFVETRRLAPFSPRGTDISVVADLMIHDLDLIVQLLGFQVAKIDAIGLAAASDKIDFAHARLLFENGSVASLTASRVAATKLRTMEIFEQHQHYKLDFLEHRTIKRAYPDGVPGGSSEPGSVISSNNSLDYNPLTQELQAFIHAVNTSKQPAVSGLDGLRALKLAIEIEKTLEETQQSADFDAVALPMVQGSD